MRQAEERRCLDFVSRHRGGLAVFFAAHSGAAGVVRLINEIIRRSPGDRVVPVCFGMRPPGWASGLAAPPTMSEDLLADDDFKALDECAIGLPRRWHQRRGEGGKGVAEFGGVELGGLVEYEFQRFLFGRLKCLEVSRKVVADGRPGKLLFLDVAGEWSGVAEAAEDAFGLPVLYLDLRAGESPARRALSRWRRRLTDFLAFSVMDSFLNAVAMRRAPDRMVLMDPRAHAMLTGPHGLDRVVFLSIYKGLADRAYAIKRGGLCFSLQAPIAGEMGFGAEDCLRWACAQWRQLRCDSEFTRGFSFKGLPIWRMVELRLAAAFSHEFARLFLMVLRFEALHRRNPVSVVVLRGDNRALEKTIVAAAHRSGVPTVFLTHGILAENNCHDVLYCTKTAVWGQADFDRYVSLGNPPESLVVTGCPKYDLWSPGKSARSKESLLRELGLDPGMDFIVYATQPSTGLSSYMTCDEAAVMARGVLSAMVHLRDLQLVIKLHPFDDEAAYRTLLDGAAARGVALVRNCDTRGLVEACRLLVTHSSTVGLEAMVLDKPVVTVNFGRRKDLLPFVAQGAALGVYREPDLPDAIKRALSDPATIRGLEEARNRMVDYYLHRRDGQSSRRAADLVAAVAAP